MTRCSIVGSPNTARMLLDSLLAQTRADEFIATAQIYDLAARRRSLELTAEVFRSFNSRRDDAGERAA